MLHGGAVAAIAAMVVTVLVTLLLAQPLAGFDALIDQKLVVGLVIVECLDDVIAIGPGMGVAVIGAEVVVFLAAGVGIAG